MEANFAQESLSASWQFVMPFEIYRDISLHFFGITFLQPWPFLWQNISLGLPCLCYLTRSWISLQQHCNRWDARLKFEVEKQLLSRKVFATYPVQSVALHMPTKRVNHQCSIYEYLDLENVNVYTHDEANRRDHKTERYLYTVYLFPITH